MSKPGVSQNEKKYIYVIYIKYIIKLTFYNILLLINGIICTNKIDFKNPDKIIHF